MFCCLSVVQSCCTCGAPCFVLMVLCSPRRHDTTQDYASLFAGVCGILNIISNIKRDCSIVVGLYLLLVPKFSISWRKLLLGLPPCMYNQMEPFITTQADKKNILPAIKYNIIHIWSNCRSVTMFDVFGIQVYLCGNNAEAKQAVTETATKLGFSILDRGSLSAARELEDFPLQLFPGWRLPIRLAIGLTASFFFYLLLREVIYSYIVQQKDMSFRIMVSLANKVDVYQCIF